ncbi:hypothetical protein TVAG_417760 [Trichomonas vaginalis G3]|uniref:Uncharacterized protein n=1 Tax=Trichomonas vaginalis (strain ATCC PRA-98 / G3) TaxID=412133 RepID=A2ED96_TRIV3|nr:experimental autoimmune prostatitis antigen 2-related family [Trichomonas vaginalis G3]EAY09354.1 hypothetical protein TVAG_417760 [Trichomonas vaginalis G3]KAI5501710.1 experimental autoimmune prostatitis antigen 2-related family [Trichomonas vaginalis G3]|eukprot:XP_001321577.1 hypothetical protein [Trichomonas vaginalis G3]
MGCVGSSVKDQVVAEKPLLLSPGFKSSAFSIVSTSEVNHCQMIYQSLLSDVHEIKYPITDILALSLDRFSIPIILSFYDQNPEMKEILFPLLSIHAKNAFRIAATSTIQLLQPEYLEKSDNSKLIKNLFKIFNRKNNITTSIIISKESNMLSTQLKKLKIENEIGNVDSDFNFYSTMIISTDIEYTDELDSKIHDFIFSGGSVIVIFNKEFNNWNKFLQKHSLLFERYEPIANNNNLKVILPKSFADVSSYNLISFFYTLQHHLSKEDTNINIIDDILTQIRIHIKDLTDIDKLTQIYNPLYDYIQENQTISSNYCMILLDDISQRLPYKFHKDLVPSVECPLHEFKTQIKTKANEWTFLNIFLPPKTISSFICSDDSVFLQVGCHTDNLISCQCPWNRYPNIVKRFQSGEIYSDYGGFLFLISDKSTTVDITLSNVADIEYSPFKIIDLELFYFIIPSDTVIEHNESDIISFYQKINHEIETMIPFQLDFKPIIVFDITDGDIYNDIYPISIHYDNLSSLINPMNPSDELKNFISRLIRLRLGHFEIKIDIEDIICNMSSQCIMKRIFNSNSSDQYLEGLNIALDYFINRFGFSIFSQSIVKFVSINNGSIQEFIKEICFSCGHNISPLFSNYIKFGDDISKSLQSLPP